MKHQTGKKLLETRTAGRKGATRSLRTPKGREDEELNEEPKEHQRGQEKERRRRLQPKRRRRENHGIEEPGEGVKTNGMG